MTETTNYKLKKPGASDPMSITPINDNMETIDAALHALASGMSGKAKMACGSYAGDGKMSVTIATPGMKPQAVVMRGSRYQEPASTPRDIDLATLGEATLSSSGFVLWIGQDITRNYWIKDGQMWVDYAQEVRDAYYARKGAIIFTSANGSLTWTLSANPAPTADIDHSALVNNKSGYTYEWIAFGTEV